MALTQTRVGGTSQCGERRESTRCPRRLAARRGRARISPRFEELGLMRREIFSEEHEMFRAQVRRFVETELVPKIDGWNRAGMSDRESWLKMGAAGFLG